MPPRKLNLGLASQIPPGSRRIINEGILSIGVFNIQGTFHAIENVCPHQGAPLCEGAIQSPSPVVPGQPDPLAGRVIVCPWHAWDFDITTGQGLYVPGLNVATFPTEIDENGNLLITI